MFEFNSVFKNSHIIISCILHQAQFRIHVFALIDSETSVYAFIDKSFVQQHNIPLHPLIYPWRLWGFDDQTALTDDITYVTEITMVIKGHTERLFLYITELNQYSIVMGLSWLCHHTIDVNFEYNTLIIFSSFCLAHCCPSSVKVYDTIQEEKEFLSFKKSQQVWELQDQENLAKMNNVSPNPALSHKEQSSHPVAHKGQSSIQSAHKEQSSHSVAHKGQSSIQSAHKEQSSHPVAHKGQSSIQSAHKEQSSHTVAHKGQSSTQSACQKQPSHLVIHQEQPTLAQAEQPSNPVILKEPSSIPAAPEEPLSLVSPAVELDTPSCIAQAIQREYQSKIEYQNSSSLQINHKPFMQLNVTELKTQNFD